MKGTDESTSTLSSWPRLGAPVSVAGGLENAFAEGTRVGCECLQIFVRNQRQWRAAPLTEDHVGRFEAARQKSAVRPIVAHGSYLLNLASTDDAARS